MFLLLTIACFPRLPYQLADDAVPDDTGAPDTAADTGQDDTSDSGGQIAIDSVEPHDGPVTGGLEVVITGGGWGDAPAVYFGDTGATLLSVGGDTLTVELPHAPEAGVVDVRIEQGHDSGLAKGGFHYWSDATGKAVFLGAATWLEPGNPDLWADPAPSLSVSAQLIEPLDITYRDLLGAGLESCSQNVVGVDRVDGPDHLETTGAFGTWSVPEDTYAGYYYINDEPTASWSSHATLDLLVPDGGTYPGFDRSAAWQFGSSFGVSAPSLTASSPETVSGDPLTVTWTSTGAAFTRIYLYDQNGDATADCLAEDDGSFTLPSSALDDFAWYRSYLEWGDIAEVVLIVISYEDTASTVPFDNGEVRTVAGYGQYGPARLWKFAL